MRVQPIKIKLATEELLVVDHDAILDQHLSTLAKRTDLSGASRIIHIDRTGIELVNILIAEMYLVAFSGYKGKYIPYHRLHLLDLPDHIKALVTCPMESLASWDESFQHSWRQSKSFIYSLQAIGLHEDMKFQILLDDLNRHFGTIYGIKGSRVFQEVECLCLVHDGQTPISNAYGRSFFDGRPDGFTLQNKTLDQLVRYLDAQYVFSPGLPVVDQTTLTHPMTISIQADMHNLDELNAALIVYGLTLKRQVTSIEMLQISYRSRNNPQ